MALTAVSFDTDGMRFEGEAAGRRAWMTPTGDAVLLYHFGLRPDLPEDLQSDANVRAFYEKTAAGSPVKVVEAGRGVVGGCRAVRVIVKSPQQPTGMTYVGSVTLPFSNFSYVIKVQCVERGRTGQREAILFDRLMKAGRITLDVPKRPGLVGRLLGREKPATGQRPRIVGEWDPDNLQWDPQFPDHPVSRVRRILARVESSATVTPDVRNSEPFGRW